ncbi:MAG: triosephosphate isomerase [Caballeronia sp.]|nr:triosephosphate isomerase [Caballeronia sp.]
MIGSLAATTRQMPKEKAKRAKLVVGNWKMHGRLAENAVLMQAVAAGAATLQNGVRAAVCVPMPYLAQAQALLGGSVVAWGVQDVSAHKQGAYTGEVAASMAADFDATFAIVGHSERRAYHGERSDLVAVKAQRALEAGLTPIVCVGETLEQRDNGLTEQVIGTQLEAVLLVLSEAQAAKIVVAYEPVWAIGTGKSATAAQAQQVHAFLRSQLAGKGASAADVPVLYGGSVKPENAEELFAQQDIDGGLIGGASLKSKDFLAICQAAQNVSV